MNNSLFELWRDVAKVPLSLPPLLTVTEKRPEGLADPQARVGVNRKAEGFLLENGLRSSDLRCKRDIKTHSKYQPLLKNGTQDAIAERIETARYQSEIGNLEESAAIAMGVKKEMIGVDASFAHRCVLRCDWIIRDAGQLITIADPEKWRREARSVTERCIAAKEWPAAIASLGSEAVILRDRAFLEVNRYEHYLEGALDLIRTMQDLLAGKCSGPKFDRDLVRHVEFETLFLKIRFAVDLDAQVAERDLSRFKALCGELNEPRLLLDMKRGLAIYHISECELDEAAEFLTPAIWQYEHHPERRSPYTFFSLLKSVCSWADKADRHLPVEQASQLFAGQYAQYAQSAIKARFLRFVPGFRRWPCQGERYLSTIPRSATRTSNLGNHPGLLKL